MNGDESSGDGEDLFGGMARPHDGESISSTCAANGANPALALEGPSGPSGGGARPSPAGADRAREDFLKAKDAPDRADRQYVSEVEEGGTADNARTNELIENVVKAKEAADKAAADYLSSSTPAVPTGGTQPPEGGGQRDPNAQGFCEEAAAKTAECNRDGWDRGSCKDLLDKMNGCSDRTFTTPLPDGPDGVNCDDESSGSGLGADLEAASEAIVLACQSVTNPAPGEDPCVEADGELDIAQFTFGGKGAEPCGDPKALTGEEQCLGQISFMTLERDAFDVLADAADKIGGPVLIVPKPPGEGPDGGPEPGPE